MEASGTAFLLVTSLLTVALAGCVGPDADLEAMDADAEEVSANTTVGFEKIHHPDEIVDVVHELDALDGVQAERIGTSLEGRAIQLVSVGEGELETWIVGRQHGNEPTGAEAILLAIELLADPDAEPVPDAPAIVHTFREHRETLLERMRFHFVPVGNPDGAAAYQRGTATGEDPNRDHFVFAHPFSRALREAFWQRRPDACLDLHNEGLADTDYDAYGPEGPMMETEPYERMRQDASYAVREVDASGANAGAFNENYRAPEPADDHPNPTALHPGTHDMFCTTRGAPGWTPEGAIEGGDNGARDHDLAWSTRLHQVTIAAHALHWAGAYDGAPTQVWKASGVVEPAIQHTYELAEEGPLRLQAVWRQTASLADNTLTPVRFTVDAPSGQTYEGRLPHPEAWTSTVKIPQAQAGTYEMQLAGPPLASYELRAYATPQTDPAVTVERTDAGLQMVASPNVDEAVDVELTDVFDPADVDASSFTPQPDELFVANGTVAQRQIAEWSLALEPGQTVRVDLPEALENAGPFRFTATAGQELSAGVEEALNPQPN